MCKFHSADDGVYQLVSGNLERMAHDAVKNRHMAITRGISKMRMWVAGLREWVLQIGMSIGTYTSLLPDRPSSQSSLRSLCLRKWLISPWDDGQYVRRIVRLKTRPSWWAFEAIRSKLCVWRTTVCSSRITGSDEFPLSRVIYDLWSLMVPIPEIPNGSIRGRVIFLRIAGC